MQQWKGKERINFVRRVTNVSFLFDTYSLESVRLVRQRPFGSCNARQPNIRENARGEHCGPTHQTRLTNRVRSNRTSGLQYRLTSTETIGLIREEEGGGGMEVGEEGDYISIATLSPPE